MGKLGFGYNAGLPEGVRAAWGCRMIVDQGGYTDLVWNRQSDFGDDVKPLFEWLNGGALAQARERASDLLKSREMSTRDAEEFVLFEDERGRIVGNTNGSAGYLYVAAWLREHVSIHVEDHVKVGSDGVEREVKAYERRPA